MANSQIVKDSKIIVYSHKIVSTDQVEFPNDSRFMYRTTCKTNPNLFASKAKKEIKVYFYNNILKQVDSFYHMDFVYQNLNKIFSLDYYDDSTLFIYLSNQSHFQVDSHVLMLNTISKKVTVFNFGNDTNFITYKNFPTFETAYARNSKFNYMDLACFDFNTFLSRNRDFIIVPIRFIGLIEDSNTIMNSSVLLKLYIKNANKEPEYIKLTTNHFHNQYYIFRDLGMFRTGLFSKQIADSILIIGSFTSPNLITLNPYTLNVNKLNINYPFLTSYHNWEANSNSENAIYYNFNPIKLLNKKSKIGIFSLLYITKLNENLKLNALYNLENNTFLGLLNPTDSILNKNVINAFNNKLTVSQKQDTIINKYEIKINFNKFSQTTASKLYNTPFNSIDNEYNLLIAELKALNINAKDTIIFLKLEGGCPSCPSKVKQYLTMLKETPISKKVVVFTNSAENITKFAKNPNVYFSLNTNIIYPFRNNFYSSIIFKADKTTHFIKYEDIKALLNTICPIIQFNGKSCTMVKE